MKLKNINWISGQESTLPFPCRVKIRYGHPAMQAIIYKNNLVVFDQAQRAITPGQSAVFYKRNQVLGGGVIKKLSTG